MEKEWLQCEWKRDTKALGTMCVSVTFLPPTGEPSALHQLIMCWKVTDIPTDLTCVLLLWFSFMLMENKTNIIENSQMAATELKQ